jgi:integrase
MSVLLTPKLIRETRVQVQADVFDSKVKGLGVRFHPGAEPSYTLRFRIGRRLRRMNLGKCSVLELKDARELAKNHLRDVALGNDPAEAKRDAREAATFAEFCETYMRTHSKVRKKSWRVDAGYIKNELSIWRHKILRDVERRDVIALVRSINDRGAGVVANRVLSLVHKMFAVATSMDLVDRNPADGVAKPAAERPRDRVLSDDELREFWTATETMEPAMRSAWRLRLVTGQRGGEVFDMKWEHVSLGDACWTIPETKNGTAHRVPLNSMAMEILKGLSPSSGFIFAGSRGKRQRAEQMDSFAALSDFRGHDLRRTFASVLRRGKTPVDVIGKILNHSEAGSVTTRVYALDEMWDERVSAMNWWSRRLSSVLEPQSNVLPFVS